MWTSDPILVRTWSARRPRRHRPRKLQRPHRRRRRLPPRIRGPARIPFTNGCRRCPGTMITTITGGGCATTWATESWVPSPVADGAKPRKIGGLREYGVGTVGVPQLLGLRRPRPRPRRLANDNGGALDTVLGVSMAPTAVRMVLVEGENGDGATVDEDNFDVSADDDAATVTAADQGVSAILGTREGAAEGGYQLASTGVTFTDPTEAAALRDALAAHKIENVMLVSAFLAAAALAQTVGNQSNYAHTALLYVEPDTATLAVVDSADGSIVDVHRQPLPADDEAAVTQLASMVSGAEALEARPDAVVVVGSGIAL